MLRSEARQIRLAIVPPIIEGLSDALARGQIDLAITAAEFAMSDCRHGCFIATAMSSRFAVSIRSRAMRP